MWRLNIFSATSKDSCFHGNFKEGHCLNMCRVREKYLFLLICLIFVMLMRAFSYPEVLLLCVYFLNSMPTLLLLIFFSLSLLRYLLSSGLTCFVCISVVVLQLSWEGWGCADRSCRFRSAKMTLWVRAVEARERERAWTFQTFKTWERRRTEKSLYNWGVVIAL